MSTNIICLYRDRPPYIFSTDKEVLQLRNSGVPYKRFYSAVMVVTSKGLVLKNIYGPTGDIL